MAKAAQHDRVRVRFGVGEPSIDLDAVTGSMVMRRNAGRSIRSGRQGQTSRPVTRWCSTTQSLLDVESHLESARLDIADVNPEIVSIKPQPFQASGVFRGQSLRHIPDFLMQSRDGRFHLVNVKARYFMSDSYPDDVRRARTLLSLAWAEHIAKDRGWTYETFTDDDLLEPPVTRPQVLHCVSNPDDFPPDLIAAIAASAGTTRREIVAELGDRFDPAVVKLGVLHVMWLGLLTATPGSQLSDDLPLIRAPRSAR